MPIVLLLACVADLGSLSSPEGDELLRTALFRVRETDGVTELSVLLSNGHLGCALSEDQAELEAQMAASCREGARHLSLRAYDRTGRFRGTFRGSTGLRPDETTPEDPRLFHAAWYSVIEAFLVDLDGLGRTYAASDYQFWPEFGSGGEAELHLAGSELGGAFTLPAEDPFVADGLHGHFRATECRGDSSLLDLLAVYPVALCL